MGYDVYSDFDIEKHKQTFIHYFETILLPDGTVKYAVPSHQMAVENYLAKTLCKTKEQVWKMCPKSRYGDYAEWLCEKSGCIMMWETFCISPPEITQAQKDKKNELIIAGVYRPASNFY